MKLLFVGLLPSKEFLETVHSHGFSCHILKRDEGLSKNIDYDLAVVAVTKKTGQKELVSLRKKLPQTWIVAMIGEKLLEDAAFHTNLLACEAKNSVWLEKHWESLFWFSLQEILEIKNKARLLKTLEHEVSSLKQKSAELSKHSEELLSQFERDVSLAENIQRALRPRVSPHIPGISLSIKYIPAAGLGGDYYDIFEFGDKKRFGVLLADSKTHGMAATLLTVLLKLRLEEMKDRFPDSKSFMNYLNQEIKTVHAKELASLSLLYGILDRTSLTFQYTSAGSLNPFLWRRGKASPMPISNNPPLGGMDYFDFRENTLSLMPGDLLILHTDGLEAPLAQHGNEAFDQIVKILKEKDPSPDPLDVQNEFMALIDRYISKKALADDLTLIHLAVDERAMYVAKAE